MKNLYDRISFSEWRYNPYYTQLTFENIEKKNCVDYKYFLSKLQSNKYDLILLKVVENMVSTDPNYIGLVDLSASNLKKQMFAGKASYQIVKRWEKAGIITKNNRYSCLYWLDPEVINSKLMLNMWDVNGTDTMGKVA